MAYSIANTNNTPIILSNMTKIYHHIVYSVLWLWSVSLKAFFWRQKWTKLSKVIFASLHAVRHYRCKSASKSIMALLVWSIGGFSSVLPKIKYALRATKNEQVASVVSCGGVARKALNRYLHATTNCASHRLPSLSYHTRHRSSIETMAMAFKLPKKGDATHAIFTGKHRGKIDKTVSKVMKILVPHA